MTNKKKFTLTDLLIYLCFGLFTLLCIFPFYYLIINAISANDISQAGKVIFYPKGIHFSNFVEVLQLPGLWHSAYISLMRTVLGTLATVLGSSFLGFMFTQEKMWARRFWYRYTIITMYISAGLIPWFITMNNLGLTNNFWAYVIPVIVSPFNIILVKTYIESTPYELQEAADLDGANIFQIYFKVILPISTPILATVAIFSAVGQWNSFQDTLILMTESKHYTLQYVLFQYINQASSLAQSIKNNQGMNTIVSSLATAQTTKSVQYTVSVIVVIPILMIYPVFQRFFVKGIMIGSVKG